MLRSYRGYWYSVTHSSDDGGWYGEVVDAIGQDVGVTTVEDSEREAAAKCRRLIDEKQKEQ